MVVWFVGVFNFVNYVFVMLCILIVMLRIIIVMVMYSYCCVYSVLGIQFLCVVLCIVCV